MEASVEVYMKEEPAEGMFIMPAPSVETKELVEDGFVGEDGSFEDGVVDAEMITDASEGPEDEGAGLDHAVPAEEGDMYIEPMPGSEDGYFDPGMEFVPGVELGDEMYAGMEAPKDPILSSVPFVAGTIGAALIVGILLGILLGKLRIRKGFDLYED